MTKKTRSTGLLVLSLLITVLAVFLLRPEAAFSSILVLFIGAMGVGLALGIMMVPQPTRINRTGTKPKRNDRPVARRRGENTRNAGSGRNGGSGGSGGRRKKTGTKPKPKATRSGPRVKGTVKWFSDRKGFGFITPENGEEDCFVHRSSLDGGTVAEGKEVEFQIIDDEKGRRAAADVKVL